MAAAAEVAVPRMPIEAHDVKKSKMVMLKGHPCKIMDVKTSKTGKHGHMKCNITGIDVLTGKKYNDVVPGHANMIEFKLEKNEYALIDIAADGMSISVLNAKNVQLTITTDPETEVFKKLKADSEAGKTLNVTVIKAPVEAGKDVFNDVEMLESYKEDKAGEAAASS